MWDRKNMQATKLPFSNSEFATDGISILAQVTKLEFLTPKLTFLPIFGKWKIIKQFLTAKNQGGVGNCPQPLPRSQCLPLSWPKINLPKFKVKKKRLTAVAYTAGLTIRGDSEVHSGWTSVPNAARYRPCLADSCSSSNCWQTYIHTQLRPHEQARKNVGPVLKWRGRPSSYTVLHNPHPDPDLRLYNLNIGTTTTYQISFFDSCLLLS